MSLVQSAKQQMAHFFVVPQKPQTRSLCLFKLKPNAPVVPEKTCKTSVYLATRMQLLLIAPSQRHERCNSLSVLLQERQGRGQVIVGLVRKVSHLRSKSSGLLLRTNLCKLGIRKKTYNTFPESPSVSEKKGIQHYPQCNGRINTTRQAFKEARSHFGVGARISYQLVQALPLLRGVLIADLHNRPTLFSASVQPNASEEICQY